jgi:hypothetical protein
MTNYYFRPKPFALTEIRGETLLTPEVTLSGLLPDGWAAVQATREEHTVAVSVSKLQPGSYHYALEVGGRPVAHHNLMVQ